MERDVTQARARARAIEQGVKVELVSPGVWVAESVSRSDRAYLLRLDSFGRPTCTCPGYQHRLVCKHAAALAMRLRA